MSTSRLTFLYPQLFLPARCQSTKLALRHSPHISVQNAGISTTQRRKQETYAQRYGTAAEPQPPPGMPSQGEKSLAGVIEKEVKGDIKPPERKKLQAPPPSRELEKKATPDVKDHQNKDKPDTSRDATISTTMRDPSTRATELDQQTTSDNNKASTAKPLETVMQMGAPTVEKPEEHRMPHLHAPPYVHHFDTFTLVKDLERGGFSDEQSVTIMKAVRGLLAVNMDVAKEGLISKSDVENETYLFRAACSELRTEILNTRRSSSTHTRTQLSHLQHTHDILSQRVSQETLSLKDELRGMLNDRRMASRMQSQTRDGEISELNYKISVVLGSGQKSEVEGLRWVMARRAAMAIGVMAVMSLGALRYGSHVAHEKDKKEAARKETISQGSSGTTTTGVGFTVPSREMGTQTGGGEDKRDVSEKSENIGYVSLG